MTAQRVKEIVKGVAEKKTLVSSEGLTAVASDSLYLVSDLCSVANETGENDRIGSQVDFHSFHIKGHVQTNTTVAEPCIVRVMLIMINHTSSATITTASNIFPADVDSFPDYDAGEFQVLSDKVYDMNLLATGSTRYRSFDIYIPVSRLQKKFRRQDYTGTAASTHTKGRMYMYVTTNLSTASNEPYIKYNAKFRYTDL